MGVGIELYRIRIGCCRHIYGTDVVYETITVNVAIVSKTAYAIVFLLPITLVCLSNLLSRHEDSQCIDHTVFAKVVCGVVYSVPCLFIGRAFSERLIGAVVFIHLLLLAAGVEPNPGPQLLKMESFSNSDLKQFLQTLYMTLLPVSIEFFLVILFKSINKDGYKKPHLNHDEDNDYTKEFLPGDSIHSDSTRTSTSMSRTSRTCSYLLGNKGAHMINGNPYTKGDELMSLIKTGVHRSVGLIHLDMIDEEDDALTGDRFLSHGTGFRVDCLIDNIAFEVSISQNIATDDLKSKLCMTDNESVKYPRDIIKTFLKENAVDIPMLLRRLGENISETFQTMEAALWRKHCVVDFLDYNDKDKTRFTVDWKILFGCEESDVIIVKLLEITPNQTMPPPLFLAETYDRMDNMGIARYINEGQQKIVIDSKCEPFNNDKELENAVASSIEWWTSVLNIDNISYEGCTKAYDSETGKVILKAAGSFIKGSSGSPVVCLSKAGHCIVTMIYQKGYPNFYYKKERHWERKVYEKTGKRVYGNVFLEGCTTLQKVSELLTQFEKLEIKENIFKIESLQRRSLGEQVISDIRRTNAIDDLLVNYMDFGTYSIGNLIGPLKENIQPKEYMKRIVHQWEENERFFVESKATRIIDSKLKDSNILTIVGCSGSGKSFAMHHAALTLQKQGFSLFVVHDCSEIECFLRTNQQNVLFVIDDPLGDEEMDRHSLHEWRANSEFLKACVTGSIKLVTTINQEIFNIIRTCSNLIFHTEQINLHSMALSMDSDERLEYFKQALLKQNMKIELSASECEMIAKCDIHNFPLLVHMYCTDMYFRNHPSQLFTELHGAFECRLERMFETNYIQFIGLILCAVTEDKLKVSTFDPFQEETPQMQECMKLMEHFNMSNSFEDITRISSELDMLEGIYVSITNGTYTFKHSAFKNLIMYIVGKRYHSFMFEYFDTILFLNKCRLSRSSCNIYDVLSNGGKVQLKFNKFKITIVERDERRLVAAFIKSMTKNDDLGPNIFMSDFCQDKVFLKYMHTEVNGSDMNDNKKSKIVHQIFCNACLNNYVDVITEMMIDATKYDSDSFTGLTPLAGCAYSGDVTHMQLFIDNGMNVNCECKGFTPLGLAVLNKKIDTTKILLSNGCDVNLGFYIPLSIAALNRDEKSIELLLDHRADINKYDGKGFLPLAHACSSGNISIVKRLLDGGADINKCDGEGNTPLTHSIMKIEVDVAYSLLDNKADKHFRADELEPEAILIADIDTNSIEKMNKNDEKGNTRQTNAVLENNVDIIKILLFYGADVNISGDGNETKTPLTAAAEKGSIEIVELLLRHQADMNKYDAIGNTPLTNAALKNHVDIINILLSHGADVNICGDGNETKTPLAAAAEKGSTEIVELLLHHSADVNEYDAIGNTPLTNAALKNHVDIVNILLSHGANVNLCGDGNETKTPLTAAVEKGSTEIVELLLDHSADVNKYDAKGNTLLTAAAEEGSTEIVYLLLDHSTDVNIYDAKGNTPLTNAVLKNNVDIVNILLSHGADVNLCGDGNETKTPLTAAVEKGSIEIVELLFNLGVNVNRYDSKGNTALTNAVLKNNFDIVNYLLENNADVDICATNLRAETPLTAACDRGSIQIVKHLLGKGADINQYDGSGNTPLTKALLKNNFDIINYLLENNVDVNILGNVYEAKTPLTVACEKGSIDIVKRLLQKGADVNKCDRKGNAPLTQAIMKKRIEVMNCLFENYADVNIFGDGCEARTPLTAACNTGSVDTVKRLLDKGAEVNKYDGEGNTPLTQAILKYNIDLVYYLLDKAVDVNSYGDFYIAKTPLTAASYTGSLYILQDLLRKGAYVNQYDGEGITPLTQAILKNNVAVTDCLFENNAEVNTCGDGFNAKTPLTAACDTGSMKLIKRLISKGADTNKYDGEGNTPLTQAILKNHFDVMTYLFEINVDVNICGDRLSAKTPLTAAIYIGSIQIVKRLLVAGSDTNKYDGEGNTPLTQAILKKKHDVTRAILNNNVEVIDYLLENTDNVNICGDRFWSKTPLTAAIDTESNKVVKQLLEKGAKTNKYDGEGNTPLTRAILNNNVEVIDYLLEYHADVNMCGVGFNAKTPLIAAIDIGSKKIVKCLLTNGANTTIYDEEGNTPLTRAILKHNLDIIDNLLEHSIDVNICGEAFFAKTPLIAAIETGSKETVKRLLVKGANTNKYVGEGNTPLTLAILKHNVDITNHLLENKADTNIYGDGYTAKTPLTAAIDAGTTDIVKCLLEKGADINIYDGEGNTPLTRAILKNKVDVIDNLLANKADVNIGGDRYTTRTPLIAAIYTDKTELVKLLLEKGADTNKYDGEGNTPLTRAILKNNYDVINNLLENNADVNICGDGFGAKTPLTASIDTGSKEIVKLLLEKGADTNKYDGEGNTPLTCAILKKNVDIINNLLRNNADVNICGDGFNAKIPIIAAIETESIEIVTSLLEKSDILFEYNTVQNVYSDGHQIVTPLTDKGYNEVPLSFRHTMQFRSAETTDTVKRIMQEGLSINVADNHGNSLLHYIIRNCRKYRKELFELYINQGANVNTVNQNGETLIHFCALYGSEESDMLVRLLVSKPIRAEVTRKNRYGETALHYAVASRMGNIEKLAKVLIDNGASVNTINLDGDSLLHYIAKWNGTHTLGILELLVEHGVSVNSINLKGESVLHYSVMFGIDESLGLTEMLTYHGANANIANSKGETPLHYIAKHNYTSKSVELAELLLCCGAAADVANTVGEGLLYYTAKCDNDHSPELAKLFISHGASVNACNKIGESLLHFTLCHQTRHNMELAQIFMQSGFIVDKNEDSLLYDAVLCGKDECVEIVKLITKQGISVNRVDSNGESILHCIIRHCRKSRIVLTEICIERGAVADTTNHNGESLLHYCALYGSEDSYELVELLMKKGANMKYENRYGETALHYAIAHQIDSTEKLAKILIDNGASVNSLNHGGESLLHYIAKWNGPHTLKLAKVLLEHGASVNNVNLKGESVLHYTAMWGIDQDFELAEVLLDHSIDRVDESDALVENRVNINLANSKGETPLHYTAKYKNKNSDNLAELFLHYGAVVDIDNYQGESLLHYAIRFNDS